MPEEKVVASLCEWSADSICKFLVQLIQEISEEPPSSPQFVYPVQDDNIKKETEKISTEQTDSNTVPEPKESECNENKFLKCSEDDQNVITVTNKKENVFTKKEVLLEEFSSLLVSHRSSYLHNMVFTNLVNVFGSLYFKNKKIRPSILILMPKFINACLKEFDFGTAKMFSEAKMCQVLLDHLGEATQLIKLVIPRPCFWRSDIFSSLKLSLAKLENLSILHIHYICTPFMLQDLSKSCPLLTELNLHGSEKIGNTEMSDVSLCKEITSLDISGTKVTGKACQRLLQDLPNLKWLQHCAFNCNSDSLIFESRNELFKYIREDLKQRALMNEHVNRDDLILEDQVTDMLRPVGRDSVSENSDLMTAVGQGSLNENSGLVTAIGQGLVSENSDLLTAVDTLSTLSDITLHSDVGGATPSTPVTEIKFNLKNFWLFNPSSEDMLLCLLCPTVQHLRLDYIMQDMQEDPDISIVTKLPYLNAITLNLYDKCVITTVNPLLEMTGSHLTELHIHIGDDWFFVAPVHNIVARNCHNLVSLSFEGDYSSQYSVSDSDSRLDFSIGVGCHPYLTDVRIVGVVSDARLLHLLLQSPSIQRLYLDGHLENLNDQTFTQALEVHPFDQLQELWFNVSTTVSLATIRTMLHSRNKLRLIGRLCYLARSSREEYQELLTYVRKCNLATTLVWVTDQRSN